MRPILVELPSKLLFVLAIALAVASFTRDRVLRRRGGERAKQPASSTPFYLVGVAWLLLGLRAGSWIPDASLIDKPWLPVPVFSYGVMLGSSMVIGWFLAMRLAKNDGLPQEESGAIYMWTAVWSIVGARLLYVIVQWREFGSPLEIVMINRGGLVAYGGMIGGFLASWYGCHKRKIPLLRWADVAAPSVVLGTAITRVGCLLFGCDYGKRTDLPWAIRFPKTPAFRASPSPAWQHHHSSYGLPADAALSYSVHPTQLYELLVGLFLFGVMMIVRRYRSFSGQVFLVWVIGYGILRPVIEAFRDDRQRGSLGPFSTSQVIGMTSVVLGVGLLLRLLKLHRANPGSLRLWEQPLAPAAAPAQAPRATRRRQQRR